MDLGLGLSLARRGGGSRLAAPVEAAGLGDSYIANSYGTGTAQRSDFRGWMHWANHAMGAPMRFRIAAMQGVSGETSSQVLARVSSITSLNPKPKLCFISAGNNDVNTGVATATAIANITAIIDALNAAGIVVVVGPIFARSTSTAPQIAATITINSAVQALTSSRRLIWCDWSNLVDGGGLALANVLYDGIHPGTMGARAMGERTALALGSRLAGGFRLATTGDPGGMTNGLMTGTGGTLNNGFSGTNANSWVCFRSGVATGGTQTLAKVARSDGNGEWLQAVFTGLTFTGPYSAGPQSPAVAYATAGLTTGDWAEVAFEAEIDAGATNLDGVSAQVLDNDGATTVQSNWTYFVSGGAAHVSTWSGTTRLVCRTPPFQIRADAGADSITVRLCAVGDAAGGGGITATMRFGRLTLRKV